MIISCSASQSLAAALATETGRTLADVSYTAFPDGELLFATEPDADTAIVIGATPTSDAHIELLLAQDAAREAGAQHITTVIPYMGYARQDTAFEPGQPVSARAVATAIGTGTDHVLVVNPHTNDVCDYFGVPAEPVDAASRLAEPLPESLTDPVFLAPDEGAISIGQTVRDAYGAGAVDYFTKTRLSGTTVEIAPSDTDVADRDIVIVDDIIATGGTMSEAIGVLTDRGAARIYATCIHPVLARNARVRLAKSGITALYGTDTLERAASTVSVAPVLADRLRDQQ